MSSKPTIVLVHGLWADGSSWSRIINPLVDKGYKVIAVQNPTTSLADDVAVVKTAIDRAGGDVILVGHSWGGFVITEAGADPRVKGLVYVAAVAPDQGETVSSLFEKFAATDLQKALVQTNGTLTISRDGDAVFEGSTQVALLKRGLDELVWWLFRAQDFPVGAVLLTGTSVIPAIEFRQP